jgi:glycosyltransferase involved in cell wall biosynthesis
MRVLMLSKACIVGIYQRKLEEIARLGVDLLALVPPSWRDERGETPLERAYTEGYTLEAVPIARNGDFHLHFFPTLGAHIRRFQPDIVHIDEEPYNLAAWHALYHAKRAGAKTLFFSWQNINRRYPPPFGWGERWTLNTVDYAIAGTESAAQVWRAKGYRGRMAVIAQFGTDPALFQPAAARPDRPFTIGYFGRLVEEKGIALLIRAAARLRGEWRLILLGGGPGRDALARLADDLGVADRVEFRAQMPSTAMPAQYHDLDALVLPSLTRPNWKEQFGRVLVEAMASGVPVVGSNSGAIPDVIGDAGLIVPEGDVTALTDALERLCADPALRADLGGRGRARAVAQFTHASVAAATVAVYGEMVSGDTSVPRTNPKPHRLPRIARG